MNSRFYSPSTGRFLTQDSYSGSPYVPWTQHLYSYTGNNPVNYVDPTGHVPRPNFTTSDSGGNQFAPPVAEEPEFIKKTGKITYTGYELVSGSLEVAGSGVLEVASLGTFTPVSIPIAIHGGNSLYSGVVDVKHIWNGEYDRVGETNLLRDAYTAVGGEVGEWLGDKEAGEGVAQAVYYGTDIIVGSVGIKRV